MALATVNPETQVLEEIESLEPQEQVVRLNEIGRADLAERVAENNDLCHQCGSDDLDQRCDPQTGPETYCHVCREVITW